MTFDEVLDQIREMLQREGRVSYRALKRRFTIDDEYIDDLKAELIDAKHLAVDEDGKVLVWVGKGINGESEGEKTKRGKGETVKDSEPRTLNSELPSAERRQLTVMFCDLVGSTALSAQLDPEELREVVRGYQETCTAVIRRYDGHIAQHLGDGLLVYFGYPAAHEDDAARAVRAGVEIITAIQKKVPSPLVGEGQEEGMVGSRRSLRVRIGIHTGLVVIGEIGSSEKREMLALGETPNIAARIQGRANPDEVIISTATYRLVEGLFVYEDRGQPELKGVTTPLNLYRVVKESDAHSRFEVVVRRGLTPLIGREHEFGLLHERWERVKDGTGQVVLLSGEPGIGKSRLVEALKATVEPEGARFLELRCSLYTQNSALAPVIEHLQRVLRFRPEDSDEEKLHKLEQALARRDEPEQASARVIVSVAKQSLTATEIASSPEAPRNDTLRLQEVVPLLAALLSLPHPDGYPPLTFSPQKQKEKTHEALVGWLCSHAKQQAVVYAWEDLHWADPSTLELLTLFLQQVPTTRLLTVLTFRPEFTPPWGAHSYLSQLSLSRLGRNHVETMVEKVTGGKTLPQDVVQQIVSKTDGVPLFVEELTKSVVEGMRERRTTGNKEQEGKIVGMQLAIPATLQDSLMARLDRLGTTKEIAQLGATLGREFHYDLLRAVSALNEDILQQGLKQLVESELVYQSGVLPQARYLFKHALVQDTAYQSLLKSRRQQLHQQVAQVLEENFPQTVETQPELVAHHYTEANLAEQAIPYWQRAGERAAQRSAYVEAISHFTRGLEVLTALPDTTERAQQELTLQLALGPAVSAVKGYAAPEVEKAGTRARELCLQLGENPQLMSVLGRLWLLYHFRGELQTAQELAEQLMRLAQSTQNRYSLAWAHLGLGMNVFYLGEFASAQTHLEQAMALYDPQIYVRFTGTTVEPRVVHLSYTAPTLWYLGYPDQSLKKSQESLGLAAGLSHPFSLAHALWYVVECHLLRREEQLVRERTEAMISVATEQGFPLWLALGAIVQGWTLVEQGHEQEGIAKVRQGLAAHRAIGHELGRSSLLARLAEAYGKAGQPRECLSVLAEGLAQVEKIGERYYEAELYRVKGELTFQSQVESHKSKIEEAEACFLKAIDIARKQQAKSLELRASTSLARLWQQQGKRVEAHKLLSEVYNWFTEGFDTKDLQEAKALLEELV